MSFRVVPFNILAHAYIKPDRYPYVSAAALEPQGRRKLLLQEIAKLKADVYCLQEVEPDAFEAIATHLQREVYDGVFAQKRGGSEGCAIFVRRSAFTLASNETLHFQAGTSRDAQLALIAHLSQGDRSIKVASTHLRWQPRRTGPGEHVGRRQLAELLDLCGREVPSTEPWIVAGDFNAISESCVLHEALNRGWKLSCRSQRPWDTCNINERRRKLDYLLYTPATLRPFPGQLEQLAKDTPMPSMRWPSDHLAVSVDYEW